MYTYNIMYMCVYMFTYVCTHLYVAWKFGPMILWGVLKIHWLVGDRVVYDMRYIGWWAQWGKGLGRSIDAWAFSLVK